MTARRKVDSPTPLNPCPDGFCDAPVTTAADPPCMDICYAGFGVKANPRELQSALQWDAWEWHEGAVPAERALAPDGTPGPAIPPLSGRG